MKTPPVKKLSKLDALAASVAQDYKDQNTIVIRSRIRVLECEEVEADRALTALQGAVTNMREKRARIEAMLRGLEGVVSKR